mgnify:CR=1 FL=1|tara:strand:+ start:121 stop:690 length:570 start_codon:yes stop_codon:yes gene_type:complete
MACVITKSGIACSNPEEQWIKDMQDGVYDDDELSSAEIVISDSTQSTYQIDSNLVCNTANSISTYATQSSNVFTQLYEQSSTHDMMAMNDVLETFANFCEDRAGVTKQEFLDLPMKSLLAYMILETAKLENLPKEILNDEMRLLDKSIQRDIPRCKATGRFISKDKWQKGICFESPQAMEIYCQREFSN